jgi:hypothetical protein
VVVSVLLLGTVALVFSADDEDTPPPCRAEIRHGVLPKWARAGFSADRPRLPDAIGRSGDIAALLFGYPLRSPRPLRRSNKILWVSRPARGALGLTEQRRTHAGSAEPRIAG